MKRGGRGALGAREKTSSSSALSRCGCMDGLGELRRCTARRLLPNNSPSSSGRNWVVGEGALTTKCATSPGQAMSAEGPKWEKSRAWRCVERVSYGAHDSSCGASSSVDVDKVSRQP